MTKTIGCVAIAIVLLGCEKPEIQVVRASGPEDQPKVVSADVKVTSNMTGPWVSLAPTAPPSTSLAAIAMVRTNTNGSVETFDGTTPLTAEYSALPYGTTWTATVDVPYSVLWQTNHVLKSIDFVVGAAEGCSSFDGSLRYQGWSEHAQLRLITDAQATRSTDVNWVATENARPSAVTGALSIGISDLPSPQGNSQWLARLAAGGVPRNWAGATGVRLAVKTNQAVTMHVSLLINSGLQDGNPAAPILTWVYTNNQPVEAGEWHTLEMPFPAFPPPVTATGHVFIAGYDVTAVAVKNGMQVTIDDVCPMH